MRELSFDPIRPGQNPRASETNRLQKAVVASSDLSGPYTLTGPDGHHIAPLPQSRFLIKLTEKLAATTGYPSRYAWEAMVHDDKGSLLTGYTPELSSTTTGFPAVEVFDRDAGDLPAYWEAWFGGGDYLLFDIGCCGDCETNVEDFTLRNPGSVLTSDRLLAVDPVNHVNVAWLADQIRQLTQATSGFSVNTYGSTVTFDLYDSTKHQVTLTGSPTYALTNEYANAIFTVRSIQDSTGGHSPTFFSTVRWQYGVQPPLNPLPNAVTDLTFERLGSASYRHLGTQYWMS